MKNIKPNKVRMIHFVTTYDTKTLKSSPYVKI